MTRAMLVMMLALAAAPAAASLGAFDLTGGSGGSVVEAPGAAPRREQGRPFRMQDSTSGRVIARSGAMTICTDGKIRDPQRARALRRHDRNHQQTTSLTTGGEALDPDQVPFFVLPRRFGSAGLGDLALVTYNGRSVWAVAGDNGPCEGCMVGRKKHKHAYLFGEGSVALARALGVPGAESGNGGGVSSGVSYLIFPGTAPKGGFRSQAELRRHLDETGAALYGRFFGDPRPVRVASLDGR